MDEKIAVEWYKRLWRWTKSVFLLASNIAKILNNQAGIKERLDKIEEAIKSPQYQVAELEKVKLTIDLLKVNNEEEIKRLKTGTQQEIAGHKARIEELEIINSELSQYKSLLLDAITIIKEKNYEIKQLNATLVELKKKAPLTLSEALAGSLGGLFLPNSLPDDSFQSALSRALSQRKDLQGDNK